MDSVCIDWEDVPDMLRRSVFCLMTVAVIGIRIEAQEAVHGAASDDNTNLERCCGRKNIGTGERRAGTLYKAAVGIFQGKVKQLNNKEIVIENDLNQMVSIRRSHKTRFVKNNQPIKPSDIDLETPVTIDASDTGSLRLLARNVSVDSPQTKTDPK